MNSDFIKGVNKAIDAATGVIGGDYTYKYHTDVTRALDRLADVIAGAAAAGMHFEVYDELPATGESDVIYLIPRESTETGNIYDEYIWTENEGFEKIGSTDVDLSGYVTTDDLATALNGYVAKEAGKGLSTNDFTDALLTKLNGISAGAEANVQSDWNESDSSSDAYIANKPEIPAAQVNSDWNASSGVAQILNKPTIPSDLNDISDVTLTSPTDGQVLTYDQANQIWVNGTGGGGGNANCVTLTQAQYNDLSQAEKNNGTYYYISDADVDSSSTGLIDDTSTPSADRVWSSSKTAQEIASAAGVTIDDSDTSLTSVWSSSKTDSEISDVDDDLNRFINDTMMHIQGWSPNGTYYLNDIVRYPEPNPSSNRYYKCLVSTATTGTWESNEWEGLSTEEIIQNYIARPFTRLNVNYPVYPVGSYVFKDANLWRCTTPTDGSKDFDRTEWEIANITDRFQEDNDFIFVPDSSIENIITVNEFKMKIKDNVLYLNYDFQFASPYYSGTTVGRITRSDGISPAVIIGVTSSISMISMVNIDNTVTSLGPFKGVESFLQQYSNDISLDLDRNQTSSNIRRAKGNFVYPLD